MRRTREAYVFDQIHGLPVHVLVVHVAVVFVPLLILAAVVYALVPPLRGRVGWVAFLLAIATPVATYVSRQSGERFFARKFAGQPASPVLTLVNRHMEYGSRTFWFSLGLGVATLLLLALTRPGRGRRLVPIVLEGLVILVVLALSVGSGYYVYETGDTGAQAVHGS
jgi:uncharacterized membrane protein